MKKRIISVVVVILILVVMIVFSIKAPNTKEIATTTISENTISADILDEAILKEYDPTYYPNFYANTFDWTKADITTPINIATYNKYGNMSISYSDTYLYVTLTKVKGVKTGTQELYIDKKTNKVYYYDYFQEEPKRVWLTDDIVAKYQTNMIEELYNSLSLYKLPIEYSDYLGSYDYDAAVYDNCLVKGGLDLTNISNSNQDLLYTASINRDTNKIKDLVYNQENDTNSFHIMVMQRQEELEVPFWLEYSSKGADYNYFDLLGLLNNVKLMFDDGTTNINVDMGISVSNNGISYNPSDLALTQDEINLIKTKLLDKNYWIEKIGSYDSYSCIGNGSIVTIFTEANIPHLFKWNQETQDYIEDETAYVVEPTIEEVVVEPEENVEDTEENVEESVELTEEIE